MLLTTCIFTVKAQSYLDSSFVRDLSYSYVNLSNLPQTISGDLSIGSKILKDIHPGRRAIGFSPSPSNKMLDICLQTDNNWSGYLILCDENFNEITHSVNNVDSCRIQYQFNHGWYYILVSELEYSTDSRPFTLTINEISQQGILNADDSRVLVYPNPAGDVLNISLESTNVREVVITDFYGIIRLHNTLSDGLNNLDINELPTGMYYLQFYDDKAIHSTYKLIKR